MKFNRIKATKNLLSQKTFKVRYELFNLYFFIKWFNLLFRPVWDSEPLVTEARKKKAKVIDFTKVNPVKLQEALGDGMSQSLNQYFVTADICKAIQGRLELTDVFTVQVRPIKCWEKQE